MRNFNIFRKKLPPLDITYKEQFNSSLAWSNLSPIPILLLDKNTNIFYVCWAGLLLPREVALLMVASSFYKIPVAHNELQSIERSYKKVCTFSAGWYTRTWTKLHPAIDQCKSMNISSIDVIKWFDKRTAMEV